MSCFLEKHKKLHSLHFLILIYVKKAIYMPINDHNKLPTLEDTRTYADYLVDVGISSRRARDMAMIRMCHMMELQTQITQQILRELKRIETN